MRYTKRLAQIGIKASVGSVGDSYDALAETVIGLYKTELSRRQGPWRHVDRSSWPRSSGSTGSTTRRLLEPLGHVPPIEYERAYYERQAIPAMEVGLN